MAAELGHWFLVNWIKLSDMASYYTVFYHILSSQCIGPPHLALPRRHSALSRRHSRSLLSGNPVLLLVSEILYRDRSERE